jgi:hypothetical protein
LGGSAVVATMLRRRRLSIVAKHNFSCGKVKNVYKTKIVVIIMDGKWGRLIKRVDYICTEITFPIIPKGTKLNLKIAVVYTFEHVYHFLHSDPCTMPKIF